MSRTHYRNGDECSSGSCDQCEIATINGVLCHEQVCPDAWKDYSFECCECGCEFYRSSPRDCLCFDCSSNEWEAEPSEDGDDDE